MSNIIVFEHHKNQLAADAATRTSLSLSRRDSVTITTAKASHTGRIFRVPLSTANVGNALRSTKQASAAHSDASAAPVTDFIFMPGVAMRKLGLSNGDVAELTLGRSDTVAATNKVSAVPTSGLGQVHTNTSKGKFNGKTLYFHIWEDIIPGLSNEFTSTEIAKRIPGKTASDINKQIRELIENGRIKIVRSAASGYVYARVTS